MDKPQNQTCRSSISHCSNLLFINPLRDRINYIYNDLQWRKKIKHRRTSQKFFETIYKFSIFLEIFLREFSSCFLQKKKEKEKNPYISASIAILLFSLPKRITNIHKRFHRRSSKTSLSFLSTNTWFLSLYIFPPSPSVQRRNNNKYIKACKFLACRVSVKFR